MPPRTPDTTDMSPARKEPDKTTYSGRFAIRLRRLREDAGLTHEQVANALEIKSDRTIYDWESANTQPKIYQLPALAEIFGVEVRTILPKK
jgi:transcriptional regulator with XRE-family HTH domain